ncbi:MAG: Ig-like domain repeat protein, partial [Terriglobales bacterium]
VVSLNNFVKAAGLRRGQGRGQVSAPGRPEPSFNFTDSRGQVVHVIVPGDWATLYNVTPLYNATPAINGAGEAIAIVGRSDVAMQDIQDFRNLFVPSNPTNLPTVILNGPDPGDLGGADEGESDLDLQWSGAVAPNATIDFVVSATTDTTDGVDLSSEYIVDHNLAPVMSTSFAACEAALGTTENAFISSLYEQAAAQGITVIDSSGDSGVAGCDPNDGSEAGAQFGPGVSGLASTPFNVAVGGTEFNEGSGTFWATSNDATTHASALGPIPEAVWNESCLNAGCDPNFPFSSSGGGVSQIYAKPPWQANPNIPGIQNDQARDVPDVAFSAADHDGYVVCQGGICAKDSSGNFLFDVFAGTSASAPSFAGVMALVNQKTGSIQGQANYTLYSLASNKTLQNWSQCNSATGTQASLANCIFLDTTVGNNSVPCVAGSPGCQARSGGVPTLPGFNAGVGYDLATGLGSINVANLANNWTSGIATMRTVTTLAISPASLTHGQTANITVTVTPPGVTGDVALIAEPPGSPAGVDFGTLTIGPPCSGLIACLQGAENALPGGSYNVVARYAGNGTFAPSLSSPVAVTVMPEGSVTTVGAFEVDQSGNEFAVSTATYGDLVFLDSLVQGAAGAANSSINAGVPSGTVAFSSNGTPFAPEGSPSTLALNSEGAADYPNGATTIAPGTYAIVGTYSGDASFNGSASSPPLALTVSQAPLNVAVTSAPSGTSTVLTATLSTTSLGLPPTGTVTFFNGTTNLGTGTVTGTTDPNTGLVGGTATLTLPTAPSSAAALYSGDTNYSASAPFTVSASPASVVLARGGSASVTLTLAPINGFSGAVTLLCTGQPAGFTCTPSPATVALNGSGTATATVALAASAAAAPPGPSRPAAPWSPWMPWIWSLGGLLGLSLLAAAARRRRRWLALGALAGLALGAAACGNNNSNSLERQPVNFSLIITASGNGASTSSTISVTVN